MDQQAGTLDPNEKDNLSESQMTLMEHLIELRVRLMWIVGATALGVIIALFLVVPSPLQFFDLIDLITGPYTRSGHKLQAIEPTETIFVAFKVSLWSGLVLAIPVIILQIIGFVAPGLYPNEKRILWMLVPGMLILFTLGAAFAFFVMLPVAIHFLVNFLADGESIVQNWTVAGYVNFVTRVVFWIGISFEMPIVITFLARIGLVSGPGLLRVWRHAIVVIAIVAAIITPTIDPISMAVVMAPLLVLYALSVGVAYVIYRPREPRDFSD